jgi:hypothetical protein
MSLGASGRLGTLSITNYVGKGLHYCQMNLTTGDNLLGRAASSRLLPLIGWDQCSLWQKDLKMG